MNIKLRTQAACCIAAAIAGLSLCVNEAGAQQLISGGAYSQTFDTLPSAAPSTNTWQNNVTLPGWYANSVLSPPVFGEAGAATNILGGTGATTTGALYSFGTNSALTDRALGSLGANTLAPSGSPCIAYGVRFTNNTALGATNFLITYTGEQWRDGNNATVQSLTFAYRVDNSAITDADPASVSVWTPVSALTFNSPVATTSGRALDGNAAANRSNFVAVAIGGFVLNPGQEIFFRWLDVNDSGNDHGLAIDDVTISFTSTTPVTNPPSITKQPTNTTVLEGRDATFAVSVSGTAPFSYQWYFTNNVGATTLITDATDPSFTTNLVSTNISGYGFFVTITNIKGSVTSSVARLTVTPAPPPIKTNIAYLHTLIDANFVLTDTTNRYQAEGVVTTPDNLLASAGAVNSFYMQNGTHGINVFWRFTGNLPFPAPGDWVRVTAPLVQFNGSMELAPTNNHPLYNVEILSNSIALPATQLFDFGTVAPGLAETNYEGARVYITNVFIAITNSPANLVPGGPIFATNLAGQEIRITVANNIALDLVGQPLPGSFATSVAGVLQQFDTTSPLDSGYELLAYSYADIIAGTPKVPLTIKKIGPDVIVSWTASLFGLQSSTNALGPYTDVLGATSPYTNTVPETQLFYRLIY